MNLYSFIYKLYPFISSLYKKNYFLNLKQTYRYDYITNKKHFRILVRPLIES